MPTYRTESPRAHDADQSCEFAMRITQYFTSESVQIISGILVTALVGALAVYVSKTLPTWPLIALLAALQLGFVLCFLSTARPKLKLVMFWAEAACLLGLHILVKQNYIGILSIVWIVQGNELFAQRQSTRLLAISILTFSGSQLYHFFNSDLLEALINVAMISLFQLFTHSASQRAIRESNLRKETGALNLELIATRELLAQSTAENERVRIARDLHDILGHHMTALILNLEAARHCMQGSNEETAKVQEKVEQSLALAKLLLGDIRTAVSELREGDGIDLQQSINRMVTAIPRCQIEVDFSEAPPINDLHLAETVLRCTQEAVTNVLKHSNATRCQIKLSAVDGKCVLAVSDNGDYKKAIAPGNGLKGMEERVLANGGTLSWQHLHQGFELKIELAVNNGV